MNKVTYLLIFLNFTFLLTHQALANKDDKSLFGKDNRADLYQTDQKIIHWSSAIANWTSPIFITEKSDGLELDFPTLQEESGICPEERFGAQPTSIISCTGFLVAPDLLLTAGHCMLVAGELKNTRNPHCTDFKWLFNYGLYHKNKNPLTQVSANNLVGCKELIYAIHEEKGKMRDYALVKLDRKMTKRYFFNLETKKIKKGIEVALLGHPSGLPQKFSGISKVSKANPNKEYFEAPLDASGGNSGSPAFNKAGNVMGILVRGNADFVRDEKRKCDLWNRCQVNGQNCTNKNTDRDYSSGMHIQKINKHLRSLIQSHR